MLRSASPKNIIFTIFANSSNLHTYNVPTIVDTNKSVNNWSNPTYTNSTPFLFVYPPWKMAEADKVTLIPLDLSIKEWQWIKIISNMPTNYYPIPNDVSSLAIVQPPDPNSKGFRSTSSLRTRWTTDKPFSTNLQLQIAPDFTNSCQINFRVLHVTKILNL